MFLKSNTNSTDSFANIDVDFIIKRGWVHLKDTGENNLFTYLF